MCAVFNPQVAQGRDDMPNWQRAIGNPISDLVPDKSSGIAAATAGSALEGAVDIADTQVKKSIDTDTRAATEGVRNDFTKELETARAAQTGGVIPAPVQSSTGGLTLTPNQPKQDVPTAVDSGISKVDSLQAALANGKINDTYYDLRLKSAVTDLRSKYPGYVDYIDQKVSQITGVNPANAYIQNLMQDINASRVQKKTAVDKAVDDAMKSGYQNSGAMIQALQQKGESFLPTFQQWYSEHTEFDAGLKRRDAVRKDMQGSKADITTQRTSDWTTEVGANVSSNLGSMVKISGLDKPQSIIDMVQDGASNPEKYTEAQYKQLGTQLLAQKAVLMRQLSARMNQTDKDAQGRSYSYASDVGAASAQEIIKNQLAVYDTMADALMKGDAGLAFYSANHARAILDTSKDNLLSDETVGNWASKMATFNETMGQNWTSLVTNQALRNNIDTKMRGYLDNDMLDARIGASSVTMKQQLQKADELQQKGRITAQQKSKYIGNLVNIVDDIKNKDAPDADKVNVLKYIFSPEGQGILSHIKTDYTDPQTGKQVPGKYSVFQRLTSDDVVKEVGRLSKSNPQLGQQYKNYMENEAGSQLFYKELQNLNYFTGHDDLHFKYNDGATNNGLPYVTLINNTGKEIRPETYKPTPTTGPYGTGSVASAPSTGYIYQVNQVVNRVNEALSGMGRVEKGLGGNVNEYLLQFMQRSQVDLGKNWEGLPANLINAIAASRTPARRIEDTFDDAKGKNK